MVIKWSAWERRPFKLYKDKDRDDVRTELRCVSRCWLVGQMDMI